jgi:hypothetical protein
MVGGPVVSGCCTAYERPVAVSVRPLPMSDHSDLAGHSTAGVPCRILSMDLPPGLWVRRPSQHA